MEDKSSSRPIPEGWRFEIIEKNNGSKVSSYFCPGTGQRFSTYEDMMRYVIYAKKAGLPLSPPNFHWSKRRNQNAGHSSQRADDKIEENLNSEKGTDKEKSLDSEKGAGIEKNLDSEKGAGIEKSLDSEKGAGIEKSLNSEKGIDIEKSLNPKKGADIEKSLNPEEGTDTERLGSEKTADAGEKLKPQNDPSEKLPAPAADTLTHDDLVLLQQMPNVPHVAPAADTLIHDEMFLLPQIPNAPQVASAADTLSLRDMFIVEQTPNIPHVVGNPLGEEDSPPVAIPPAMIPEFAAGNPKPRRFRRWGNLEASKARKI